MYVTVARRNWPEMSFQSSRLKGCPPPQWLSWRVGLVIRRLRLRPLPGIQHSFMKTDHEIISTVIRSLPLIEEGQLSVSVERMCTIMVKPGQVIWPRSTWPHGIKGCPGKYFSYLPKETYVVGTYLKHLSNMILIRQRTERIFWKNRENVSHTRTKTLGPTVS